MCSVNATKLRTPANNQFSTPKKWPPNENTHLIGDIIRWQQYRPQIEKTLNFTKLIEDKTVYEKTKSLQYDSMPIDSCIDETFSVAFFTCKSFNNEISSMQAETVAVNGAGLFIEFLLKNSNIKYFILEYIQVRLCYVISQWINFH